jgi:hypothetical protein
MKHASLCSSTIQGGGKRRMAVMIAPFPLCAESDAQPCGGGASLWASCGHSSPAAHDVAAILLGLCRCDGLERRETPL